MSSNSFVLAGITYKSKARPLRRGTSKSTHNDTATVATTTINTTTCAAGTKTNKTKHVCNDEMRSKMENQHQFSALVAVGDVVEVCDNENIWSSATIVRIAKKSKKSKQKKRGVRDDDDIIRDGDKRNSSIDSIKVRYDGSSKQWDDTIHDIQDTTKIVPWGTYTHRFKCMVALFDPPASDHGQSLMTSRISRTSTKSKYGNSQIDFPDYHWPCIINIRTPTPFISLDQYKAAENELRHETNVYVEPYGYFYKDMQKRKNNTRNNIPINHSSSSSYKNRSYVAISSHTRGGRWVSVQSIHKFPAYGIQKKITLTSSKLERSCATHVVNQKNKTKKILDREFDQAYQQAKHDQSVKCLPLDVPHLFQEGSLVISKYRNLPPSVNDNDTEEAEAEEEVDEENDHGNDSEPLITNEHHRYHHRDDNDHHDNDQLQQLREQEPSTPTLVSANNTSENYFPTTSRLISYSPIDPYPWYQEMINQKRARNAMRIKALGLDFCKEQMKRKRNRNNFNYCNDSDETKKKVKKKYDTVTRRSPRKVNKPEFYDGSESDQARKIINSVRVHDDNNNHNNDFIHEETRQDKTVKMIQRRFKKREMDNTSPQERKLLTNIPNEEWMDDMQRYFREIVNNSDTNVERVMKVVHKLVTANGVNHVENKRAWFRKNVKVHLSNDFQSMYHEAAEWVVKNGGDRGHGWLIEHPIKKLWLYQYARVENGGAFFSDAKAWKYKCLHARRTNTS